MRAKATVVAMGLGRPAMIPQIAEEAAAVLGTFGASDEGLLDIVSGTYTPTGSLPFDSRQSWR